jgi:hypothetical protein
MSTSEQQAAADRLSHGIEAATPLRQRQELATPLRDLMNRQHVGATIEVIKQSVRNGDQQEALYLLDGFAGILADAAEQVEEGEGNREARELHDGVRALGYPATPIRENTNVTTRRPARGNVNGNDHVTPNGKIIDHETAKQREKDYAKDHKLPFESSYKHNENQSYTMTMKNI